jgi:uncharacterized Fe-S cluster-containing radical SAM superfamily protein
MIDISKLSQGAQWQYSTFERGNSHPGPINHSCKYPFQIITVNQETECVLCHCDAWLPISVGKAIDFDSIEDVFNSAIARELQEDVASKKFTHCAVKVCGILNSNRAFKETQLYINIDNSCNLSCLSCRRQQFMITEGPEFDHKVKTMAKILSWLEKYQDPIHITISGDGDCLASHIMRPLVKTYEPLPNQTFTLFTNGLLMKKNLPGVPMLKKVTHYRISVDAGSREVYEHVRRPGKWSVLQDNFDWLVENRNGAQVNLAYVFQRNNMHDLENFAKMCKERGFHGEVSALENWATWSRPADFQGTLVNGVDVFTITNGSFLDNDVLNPANPQFDTALDILRDVGSRYIDSITIHSKIRNLYATRQLNK